MSSQVTSRGCSRAYIVCVLWRAWEHVRLLKSQDASISFPFNESVVKDWLVAARDDCLQAGEEFLELFGGTDFSGDDATTYWTLPPHFFTWWKNNIERKSKFAHLISDAGWKGSTGLKHATRSKYCRQILALALNIKNHFDRIVNQQQARPIRQIELPIAMPLHMKNLPYVTSYDFCDIDSYVAERTPKSANTAIINATARSLRTRRKSKRSKYTSSEEDSAEEEEGHFSEHSDHSEEEAPSTRRKYYEDFAKGAKIKKRKYEYLQPSIRPDPRTTTTNRVQEEDSRKKRGRPAKNTQKDKGSSSSNHHQLTVQDALFDLTGHHLHPLDDASIEYGNLVHGRDSDSDDQSHSFVFTFESSNPNNEEKADRNINTSLSDSFDRTSSQRHISSDQLRYESSSSTGLESMLKGKCLVDQGKSVNVYVEYIPYREMTPQTPRFERQLPEHHRTYYQSPKQQQQHTFHQMIPNTPRLHGSLDAAEQVHPSWSQSNLYLPKMNRTSSPPGDGFMTSEVDNRHSPVEFSTLQMLSDQQLGLHPTERNHSFFIPVSAQHIANLPQLKITTPSLSRSNSLSSHQLSTDRTASMELDEVGIMSGSHHMTTSSASTLISPQNPQRHSNGANFYEVAESMAHHLLQYDRSHHDKIGEKYSKEAQTGGMEDYLLCLLPGHVTDDGNKMQHPQSQQQNDNADSLLSSSAYHH